MIPELLKRWFTNYALAIGVTSFRLVDGKLQQTWLSWTWALLINTLSLVLLPGVLWQCAEYVRKNSLFPNLLPYCLLALYSVTYVTVAITILSRASLDSAIVELERATSHYKSSRIFRGVEASLRYLFYLKFSTILTMGLCSLAACWTVPKETRWTVLLATLIFYNACNIAPVAAHRYFISLWYISCVYRYINCRMDKLIGSARSRELTRKELREFYRLWSLHVRLGRCTMRINKVHGLLVLAARFDFITFSSIFSYCGLIFMFSSRKLPVYSLVYGNLFFNTRVLDCFLMDKMCDITIQYQNASHHQASEGVFPKEVRSTLDLRTYDLSLNLYIGKCVSFVRHQCENEARCMRPLYDEPFTLVQYDSLYH